MGQFPEGKQPGQGAQVFYLKDFSHIRKAPLSRDRNSEVWPDSLRAYLKEQIKAAATLQERAAAVRLASALATRA